jgi:hypothetical protein
LNKFDNKISEYRKLYNLTEQGNTEKANTGLQTGNVITNFFSNIKKYKLSNLKEQKDFIIKLNVDIEKLKNSSNPLYKDAIKNVKNLKTKNYSRFLKTPPSNNKTSALGALNKDMFVVYAVTTFYSLKQNNKPLEFSLMNYLTESDQSKRDLLASNLTIQEISNFLIKTLGTENVSTRSVTLAKDIANRLVDKTVKGIGSAIKGAASYAVGTQTVRRM